MSELYSKAQAKQLLLAAGYYVSNPDGQSGDYGIGSRIYFLRNGNKMGEGVLHDHDATMSRLPGGWAISVFN